MGIIREIDTWWSQDITDKSLAERAIREYFSKHRNEIRGTYIVIVDVPTIAKREQLSEWFEATGTKRNFKMFGNVFVVMLQDYNTALMFYMVFGDS